MVDMPIIQEAPILHNQVVAFMVEERWGCRGKPGEEGCLIQLYYNDPPLCDQMEEVRKNDEKGLTLLCKTCKSYAFALLQLKGQMQRRAMAEKVEMARFAPLAL